MDGSVTVEEITQDMRDRALASAHIPALLMSLAQLTGEEQWLQAPYLPQRDISLFAEESGGLSEEAQHTVRAAMAQVLDELQAGTRSFAPPPDDATFLTMMRVVLGENVPPEYVGMAQEEMGMRDRTVALAPDRAEDAGKRHVLIVGAGVSGIAMAKRLKDMGVKFTVVDKNADVGGTWMENDYPESGVDTPNHFYSFSFAPNHRWSGYYSKRAEVWNYLRGVVDTFKLRDAIRFEQTVTQMHWDEGLNAWCVTLQGKDGVETRLWADVVVTALGQLNRPKKLDLPGIENFPGEAWHSAQWRHDVPLAGKKVAIVGTGASAMQFLPSVAKQASQVTIFQRSPQWIRPQADYQQQVSAESVWLMENVPYYYAWYRFGLLWRFGDGLLPSLRKDPEWPHPERSMNARNDRHRRELTDYTLVFGVLRMLNLAHAYALPSWRAGETLGRGSCCRSLNEIAQ